MSKPLVSVENLSLGFLARDGRRAPVLRDLSLDVQPGQTLGIVGESGSGKSTVLLAMMGYARPGLMVFDGRVLFDGNDMFGLPEPRRARLRGSAIALIPQNAGQALTPTMTVGAQIEEALVLHTRLDAASRAARIPELLDRVRLPDPAGIARRYPHELSGGQQQRVAVAMALAGEARALLLDEPTTGLDVTTQAHILEFLRRLARETGVAMVCVSHDLGVIARVADEVAVMYAGRIVEQGHGRRVLRRPAHPYAQGLLASIPRLGEPGIPASMPGVPPAVGAEISGCAFAPRCPAVRPACHELAPELLPLPGDGGAVRCHHAGEAPPPRPALVRDPQIRHEPALALEDVAVSYARPNLMHSLLQRLLRRPSPPATVAGIGLDVRKGETLALVGESGSGKSTILRAVAGLVDIEGGIALGGGEDLSVPVGRRQRDTVRRVQMIFQNADAALNPRQTVAEILEAPLRLYFGLKGAAAREKAAALLRQVRLPEHFLDRFPGQLSGGEKQRVGVARAFAAEPEVTLCDEVTSALDVSVQAAALALLVRLQKERGSSYVFVSHDLAVVRAVADRVAVLYQGRICEIGPADSVYAPPWHPYTRVLMGAVLEPDPDTAPALLAEDASESAPPARGCPFQRRCPHRMSPLCESEAPPARRPAPGHVIHCHLDSEALASLQEEPR